MVPVRFGKNVIPLHPGSPRGDRYIPSACGSSFFRLLSISLKAGISRIFDERYTAFVHPEEEK
jgi:hypothetical protein